MEHKLLTARLTRSVLLSEKTKHLEFAVEELERLDFEAGQFVSVREPHGGKLITRAYSIASEPRGDNTFDLCLNRVDEGFMSNHLCDLNVGESARIHGPHGLFVLKPGSQEDVIMVATGTGVAPFRGMVRDLFRGEGRGPDRHNGRQVWLFYGTRYPQDMYYREEFEQIAATHPDFHYIATLSRPPQEWQGNRGYVQDYICKTASGRRDMVAYICGLKEMVSSVRGALIGECGWDRKKVIYERYD